MHIFEKVNKSTINIPLNNAHIYHLITVYTKTMTHCHLIKCSNQLCNINTCTKHVYSSPKEVSDINLPLKATLLKIYLNMSYANLIFRSLAPHEISCKPIWFWVATEQVPKHRWSETESHTLLIDYGTACAYPQKITVCKKYNLYQPAYLGRRAWLCTSDHLCLDTCCVAMQSHIGLHDISFGS